MEYFLNNLEQKIREDIPVCMSSAMQDAISIWDLLQMTEEEYNKQYHKIDIEKIDEIKKSEIEVLETGETIKEIIELTTN